ncbi:MAG: lycopene cyclase domain-containing protein [bacterium]|nr:lycopene cyclase domain-containing protein [bacterium]
MLFSYEYAYLVGCLILFVSWLFIYIKRKDLRSEILWASTLGLPFGLVDYFLVPYYWYPESLFGLIRNYGVGIESFLFFFLMAGIASVIYEFVEHKGTKKNKEKHIHIHAFPIVISLAVFVSLLIIFPHLAIYSYILSASLGCFLTILIRPDLAKQVITTGFIFVLFYTVVFLFVILIFPGWVENSYNIKSLWGIFTLGGVPLEEVLASFFAGAFWSTIYEYTKGYSEKKVK